MLISIMGVAFYLMINSEYRKLVIIIIIIIVIMIISSGSTVY